jgi:hypothetical protein
LHRVGRASRRRILDVTRLIGGSRRRGLGALPLLDDVIADQAASTGACSASDAVPAPLAASALTSRAAAANAWCGTDRGRRGPMLRCPM